MTLGNEGENFSQKVQQASEITASGIRTKVESLRISFLSDGSHEGHLIFYGDFDQRVGLTIFEVDVVFGGEFTNEIGFQEKSIDFRVDHDVIYFANFADQLSSSGKQPASWRVEIGGDPVAKRFGLANVDNFSVSVFEKINSRQLW